MSEYLSKLQQRLEKLERTRDDILENGQQHALTGSHSISYPALNVIEKQISRVRSEIMRANGGKSWTRGEFSTGSFL